MTLAMGISNMNGLTLFDMVYLNHVVWVLTFENNFKIKLEFAINLK